MHRIFQKRVSIFLVTGLFLGAYRGFVALYEDDNTSPRQIYPYKTESLPLSDQQALEKGIQVPSEKALEHMLEDYMS